MLNEPTALKELSGDWLELSAFLGVGLSLVIRVNAIGARP